MKQVARSVSLVYMCPDAEPERAAEKEPGGRRYVVCDDVSRARLCRAYLSRRRLTRDVLKLVVVRRLLGRCIAAPCVCAGRRSVCVVLAHLERSGVW